MSDSSSLILLPPRPTSQSEAEVNQSKSHAKRQSTAVHSTFRHKLASKLTSVVKQTTQKPASTPVVKAKSVVESDPKATEDIEKADSTAAPAISGEKTPDQLAAGKLPKAARRLGAVAGHQPEAKAPPSSAKQVKPVTPEQNGQSDSGSNPNPRKGINDHKSAVKANGDSAASQQAAQIAASAAASSSAQPDNAPANTDADPSDGIAPTTSTAFGSGKVVAKASDGDSEAANATSDDGSSTANAAANPTAAAQDEVAGNDDRIASSEDISVKSAVSGNHKGLIETDPTAAGALTPGKGLASLASKSSASVEASQPARFGEVNTPKIVSSIQGQLLPHGGTMQIRLDPPELGALQVTVHMRDGIMTASFETSSDHATKLLSHSLGQLKSGLEAAGMSVEKLHVEQAPKRDAQGEPEGDSKQPPQDQQQQARQDQQRREMVQRMWQKLAGGDPLDMVA